MGSLTRKGLKFRIAALLALIIILALLGISTVPSGVTISGDRLPSFEPYILSVEAKEGGNQ